MFRMMNKKGFTLVELMIVVVILGILVAIAVPIYSAVTENAQRKTCYSNMRMISGACVQYYMEHESYSGILGGGSSVDDLSQATLPEEFMAKFDVRGIPTCPAGGKYKLEQGALETTIIITCVGDGEFEGHGNYHPSN